MVNDKQLNVLWHVDCLKIRHMDPKVVDDFVGWVQQTYVSIVKVKLIRGNVHEYLIMRLDYSKLFQVYIDMKANIQAMVAAFPFYGLN